MQNGGSRECCRDGEGRWLASTLTDQVHGYIFLTTTPLHPASCISILINAAPYVFSSSPTQH